MLTVKIITACPEAFPGYLGLCLAGRALKSGLWSCEVIDLREFGLGKHRNIDDRPFGGGAGMVLCAEVVARALDSAMCGADDASVIYASARGQRFTQKIANELSCDGNCNKSLIMLCGRFEGVDQRVLDLYRAREFCIGDFILSGGEIAVMAMIDACVRLLPGVLGNHESVLDDSFSIYHDGHCLIEYPQYTRPRIWRGVEAPAELLSGNHASVRAWRKSEAIRATKKMRRDLCGSDFV